MEEEIIHKIVHALPTEALQELNQILDGEPDENKIKDLLEKYNIDLKEVLIGKEIS